MLHDTQYITHTIMWFLHNAARISSCIKTGKNHTAVLIFCLCLYLYLYLYLNLNSYFYLYNIAMCIACDGEMMAPDGWSGRSVNSTFLPKLSLLIIPLRLSMLPCDNVRIMIMREELQIFTPIFIPGHIINVSTWPRWQNGWSRFMIGHLHQRTFHSEVTKYMINTLVNLDI